DEENIITKAMSRVPNTDKIIDQAIGLVKGNLLRPAILKRNLNAGIITLHDNAYSIFLQEQEAARGYALDKWTDLKKDEILFLSKRSEPLQFARALFEMFLPFASSLEKRFGNSRRSRAGSTLEKILRVLLLKIEIPCEKPNKDAKKLKRIDLVVPNQTTALMEADKAYFISCKRTLRERWKQAITEREKNWRVYLVTLDDNLSEAKAEEINNESLIVYVPDNVKKQRHLKNKPWVRSLSDLPSDLKL
ncbi:MAG: type II restriction endonuclease, partial [Candidatus Thorarchaeota archaeon]